MKGICTECGEECDIYVEDAGIGAYEYWGATGVDIRLLALSECCDADCVRHDGTPISGEDVKYEGMEDE